MRRWSLKRALWRASSRRFRSGSGPWRAISGGVGDENFVNLFLDLDPARWRQLNHNPVALLGEMPLTGIERRAGELVLHGRIDYAYRRQQEYLQADAERGRTMRVLRPHPVAYFSAEFGLHESIPIYSGGLGVLAGDHIKSASDLDIPLIGVGLFYSHGYFRQQLDLNGWQQEVYLQTDVNEQPMEPAIGVNGEPVTVQIETRGSAIKAKVWRMKVGRCDLLLLDSNVEGNSSRHPANSLRRGDQDPWAHDASEWNGHARRHPRCRRRLAGRIGLRCRRAVEYHLPGRYREAWPTSAIASRSRWTSRVTHQSTRIP